MVTHTFTGNNFGDRLNDWLWPRILRSAMDLPSEYIFCGIGTLLNDHLPKGPKIVFGTGAGYGAPPQDLSDSKVFFLRGPRTAQALGLSSDYAITDPAILTAREWTPSATRRTECAYIPHHETADDAFLRDSFHAAGISLIDPRQSVETVLEEIADSRKVLCEAMHGAIIADSFRIPWYPARFHSGVSEFKWSDYCDSIELDYRPLGYTLPLGAALHLYRRRIPGAALLAGRVLSRQVASLPFQTSAPKVFADRLDRVTSQVDRLVTFLHSSASTV